MVAIVAGNGLGLFNTSLNTLGGGGVFGQGGLGQAGGQGFVNISNGNLILQFNDKQLSGLGLDLYHLRTYNAQGTITDADGDGWRWDGERKVKHTGILNASGSQITRTTGDGHETVYAWNGSRYQSTEGDGAHDSIEAATILWLLPTEWVWKDGSTGVEERYDLVSGRLKSIKDTSGNTISYSYDINGRLTSVKDSSGQEMVYVYNGDGQLKRLDTKTASNGALTRQVYYLYDEVGRLLSVTTDLTPSDGIFPDENAYTTSYTYDGSSFRIASVTQSDGTSVAYTYQLVGSEYRVKTVADASGTTTFTYDTANRRTDVSNGLGQVWSYHYDTAGQLIQVQTPTTGGVRLSTSYGYDAQGNVTSITDGAGGTISYSYDANGNRTLERDALGNTVRYVYDSKNQLQNLIRYTAPAILSEGAWTNPADSAAQTTRYVYDSKSNLRYAVDATGVVTEYRYGGTGLRLAEVSYGDALYGVGSLAPTATLTEATLNTWAAARDKTQSRLTELAYDYRGNLTKVTAHASVNSSGAGVVNTATQITEYVYSEHGQLLQTIAVRGANRDARTTLSSTTYDGLGRVLSQIDASGTRTTVYNGASRQIAVTSSAGLTTTQTYDTRGRLVSISQTGEGGSGSVTRTTQYVYDAAGRLTMSQDPTGVRTYTFYDEAGRVSARVDGTGAVVEYIYNGAGQLTQEKGYANPADTTGWYAGGVVTKTLVSQIRPSANTSADRVISHAYDSAGRRSSTTDAIGTVTTYGYDGRGQLVKVQTGDRVTRTFYDAAGRQAGQLDGEGYLREHIYNTTGQLQQVIRYAALTPAAQRESGTLAQLRPSATGALSTWYYYDNAGRQVGSVDEQGFVTETVFNEAANTLQSIRYATAYTTAITTATTFATIRTAVLGSSQSTTLAFDGLGRASTRTGHDGTVTRYEYDTAGRLVKETAASGTTEARTLTSRYNAFGEVTGRLLGEASARITAGMTTAQITAIYDQYGLTWSYDAAGRQVSVRDAFGNKTVTYYDEAGRVTHVVNALGEVKESLYNAFGEVREQTLLLTPLANPGSLTGGLNTTVKGQVAGLTIANDNKTTYAYDKRGLLTSTTDALNFLTSYAYNVHGERSGTTRTIASGNTVTESLTYSKRGELKSRTEDVGGLNRTTSLNYDAFGRVISQVDGRGLTTTTIYDLNGRKITVRDPLNNNRSQTFDAWGRVLSETDALGQTTNYSYNDSTRTLTVTTPDGVSISTTRNRHGEVITATDGKGQSTTYIYNEDGQVTMVRNALILPVTTNTYDNAGRLLTVKDALNNITTYAYDAASRVVSRTDALGTVTSYAFDGQGRQTTVTEAVGLPEQRVTAYTYDRTGQVLTVTQDPSGLALRTTYSYDGLGQQVEVAQGTVASPNQRITKYLFDKLGRRTGEQVDPSGLNISTEYRYNGNDQVTRKIDARGNSTWYVYDNAGRLTDTIDALGAVTRNVYDANGRITRTTRYATELPAATLTTLASTDAPSSVSPTTNAARDQVTTYVYDTAGRLSSETQDPAGLNLVTGYKYDSNGRLTRKIDARGNSTWYVYDNVGRLTDTVDALGGLTRNTYDLSGNIISVTRYVTAVATSSFGDVVDSVTAPSAVHAQRTSYTYDVLGRIRYTMQLLGTEEIVTETIYDAHGQVTEIRRYDKAVVISGATIAMALAVAGAVVHTTAYAYDKAGRQTLITSPGWYNKSTGAFQQASDGTANTFRVTTEVSYDALGNATRNRVRVSNTGTTAEQFVDSYKTYDAVGRVVHEIDALNGVTAYTYDKLGNALTIRRHANALNFAVPALGYYLASDITTARLVPDTTRDQITTYAYDSLGRLTSETQDSAGLSLVTGYKYDANGRLTRKIDARGNSTWYVYDNAGRLTDTIDALGSLTRNTYDAAGNVTSVTRYATAVATSSFGDVVASVTAPAVTNAQRTFYIYDNVGRVRYTIQSLSTGEAVTETVYDANGRVTESRQYDKAIAANTTRTLAATATALTTAGAVAISTTYVYDNAGRLTSTTDALNKTESYTYDALGNRKTLKNKNNAVWTYNYDALGRLTEEITPQLSVSSITAAGVVSANNRYLVTTIGYDALGNVTSRVEGRQRTAVANAASSDDLSQARTTTYGYDKVGRQTLITSPGWYNKSTGAFQQASDGTANTFQVTTEVTYDALGNATRNRVRVSNTGTTTEQFVDSYKTYDAVGRVVHEIDALNGVTAYTYDKLGNALTIKRHASALNFAVPALGYYLASDITTARLVPDAANDRTLTMTYDLVGRKTSVQQDQVSLYTFTGSTGTSTTVTAAPTTVYSYNALGQLTKETQIARNSSGATVQTGVSKTWYYDVAGNQVGLVTGVPGTLGYYTKSEYNALGQLTRQIEYAKALTTSWTEAAIPSISTDAKDRSTAYAYDSLGRLIRVTQENVTYWTRSTNPVSQVTGNLVVSETTYDGVGNVLTQKDAANNVTTTEYNALGQITKVIEPARSTARADVVNPFGTAVVVASPTTTYDMNAFGQVVRSTRAAGKDAANNTQAGLTQVTRTVYDAAGNEIKEIDATNAGIVDYKVDAAGRRTEERQLVSATLSAWTLTGTTKKGYSQTLRTTYTYDRLGKQASTSVWYMDGVVAKATTDAVWYNRFGEVMLQTLNGYAQTVYGYDQAGRVITQTNAQGLTQLSYNLGGQVSRSIQAGSTTTTADDRITYTRHNVLGQVTEQHLPAFEANINADTLNNTTLTLATPIIKQTVDRWGNALTRTDARNQTTTWTYNHNNQVLTETLPQTDILRENGTSYRASLIREQRHDALGLVIQEADLVGPYTGVPTVTELRKRHKVYNEIGQLIQEIDASGVGNLYRYDSNGNRVASRNGIGTVLTQTYDAMDRQLTHGIIRSGARTVLQTNQYDQAGRLYGEVAGATAIEETLQAVANTSVWTSTITGVAGNTKYTIRDERGNVIQTRNESKIEKSYVYDQGNRKVEERDGLTNTLTWTYDDANYGRLLERSDLAGRRYVYSYNNHGQVFSESLSVNGVHVDVRIYEYNLQGLIAEIVDQSGQESTTISGGKTHTTYTTLTSKTIFSYDLNGEQVREVNQARNYRYTRSFPVSGSGSATVTVNFDQNAGMDVRYRFDEQGRLSGVYSPAGGRQLTGAVLSNGTYLDGASGRIDELSYYYDEFGNRRRVYFNTVNHNGGRTIKDLWYTYDAADKALVVDGAVNGNGRIVAGWIAQQGYLNSYDAAGRVFSTDRYYKRVESTSAQRRELFMMETYRYDDLGNLTYIDQQQNLRDFHGDTTGGYVSVSGWSARGSIYKMFEATYDNRGNRLTQRDYKAGNNGTSTEQTKHEMRYRGDGMLVEDLQYAVKTGGGYRLSQANYFGEAGMINAVGNQVSYRYVIYKTNETLDYRGEYTKSYGLYDSYKESGMTAIWIGKNGTPGTSTQTYSERGELQVVYATGGTPINNRFSSSRDGRLVYKLDRKGAAQSYVFYQGSPIASIGNSATPEVMNTLSRITSSSASGPSNYLVNEGDTLELIAQTLWGNARLWYLIADANGLDAATALVAGDNLQIPSLVGSPYNDDSTFKPYNPADVIGNTTPSPKPPPPPKKKCGGLASIVMVVVAAVAVVVTAGAAVAAIGAASGGFGAAMGAAGAAITSGSAFGAGAAALTGGLSLGTSIAAAAIGGAVGSAVGQLAGMAMGVVDEFSWRQVAVGGLGAGLTAGAGNIGLFGSVGQSASWSQVATTYARNAAVSYSVNQLSSRVAGLDTSFSWRGVAASVAGAVAGGAANRGLGLTGTDMWSGIARSVISGSAHGYFNQQWARGGKIDFVQLAMDSFGNAIGNDIVDKLTPKPEALDARALKALQSQANMTESERAQVQAKLDAQGGAVYERHDGAWYDEDGKAIDGVNGAFDRETGRILISGSLLDAAGTDPMAAATLQRVLYEEEGHRVASMLEDIRGIRDFAGDEGALIARTLMLEDIGQATSGRFNQQVSLTIGGQNLSFQTDAGHLAVASLELFDANYLALDRQSGRYEFSTAGKVAGKLAAFYEMGEIDALNSAKADLQGYIQRTGGDSVGAQALSMAVDLLFPTNVGDLIPVGRLAGFGSKVLGAVGDGLGRTGRQARLRELAGDDKLGAADRGWLRQEINSIERGQRNSIRNPPGKDLAHERGREAAKGYSYEHANLQDRNLHRLQHKYDDFGRKNQERPVR